VRKKQSGKTKIEHYMHGRVKPLTVDGVEEGAQVRLDRLREKEGERGE